jgi:hypothetical protein
MTTSRVLDDSAHSAKVKTMKIKAKKDNEQRDQKRI